MYFIIVPIVLILAVYVFMQQQMFGQLPSGERLKRIESSPNYRDGKFQNQSFTPDLAEGETMFKVLKKFFFLKRISAANLRKSCRAKRPI